MDIQPNNKLYDESDILREGENTSPVRAFSNAYNRMLEITYELKSRGQRPDNSKTRMWEWSNSIESTNPSSGDIVCVVEGYHQPHSVLPFYLSEIGCEVTVIHNVHEFWWTWISQEEYVNAGINRAEVTDWYNVPSVLSNVDIVYCHRELEHTHEDGVRYLSDSSYDEVLDRSKKTLDLWLSVSKSVSCTHNLFGTNCSFEDLVMDQEWEDAPNDFHHPYTPAKLSELLANYSVNIDYEDFSSGNYGDTINNWSDYYKYNSPRSRDNLPIELYFTIASFTITK